MVNNKKYSLLSFRNKLVGVFIVLSMGFSMSYAKGKAEDYIRYTIENTLTNSAQLECEGDNRSAICTTPSYSLEDIADGLMLRDLRYTVNYLDSRIIEHVNGKFAFSSDESDDKTTELFFPQSFECQEVTSLKTNKNIVHDYLSCQIMNNNLNYALKFRLHTSTTDTIDGKKTTLTKKLLTTLRGHFADLIDDRDSFAVPIILSFLQETGLTMHKLDVSLTFDYTNLCNKANTNRLGSEECRDFYQYFDSMIVGRLYGFAIGSVYANDNLNKRTKDSLLKLLKNIKDSMLLIPDSRVKTLIFSFTNRYKTGFTLLRAIKELQQGTNDELLGAWLNNYRIESGVLHKR
ncbi:hypothetical protein CQA66_00695 [Helicobacter aurati]|uniref:Uncharacterized protein n=1 Tax=Helicobacter aurati TaxID=137778 RepID=A0A3D8J9F5_9HELI|nr:hypothetical protein [Helicobacter aurati]RDU73736.1 hypothetical protein CQA66_00695 [Helicobacter aurati]